MSIHMPTLFDDEEYFVPPPKKDAKKKKEVPEAPIEELKTPEAEADTTSDVAVPAEVELEADAHPEVESDLANPVTEAIEITEDVVNIEEEFVAEQPQAREASASEFVSEENLDQEDVVTSLIEEEAEVTIPEPLPEEVSTDNTTDLSINADTETQEEEEPSSEINETTEVPAIELEHQAPIAENIAATLIPEVIEVSAVDELTVELPKATSGITFEIPEEEEAPSIELEMTARPIPTVREDKVDDLDQLMRSEIISQDYSAFSGFEFEAQSEKKKIIPEPEDIAEEPEEIKKEDISLAVQEIDAAGLDFAFESDELASSLPEFELENKYYTIGEVAGLFGVNVSHIRFWTTEFNLKVRTTRKGDRLYNPENIARLRLIHHLVKENGFTIKGAKDKLKNQKQNVSVQIDLKNKLSGLKDKLERIKKNL